MSKDKELATKASAEVAQHAALVDDVFGDLAIEQSDLVIPKVLLMQPVSAMVAEGKAQIGDFRHSLSGEKLGTILDPLVIVPFHYSKCIDIVDGATGKLIRKDEYNIANAKLPREDKENGQPIRRYQRMDFFCMVPKLLESGSSLPVVVSFKSTGYRAGGIILTQWQDINAGNMKAKQEGRIADLRLPFSKMFALAGVKTTNDKKQTYCAPSIQVCGDTPQDLQGLCLQWLKTIKSGAAKVDDRDDNVEHVDRADGTGAF